MKIKGVCLSCGRRTQVFFVPEPCPSRAGRLGINHSPHALARFPLCSAQLCPSHKPACLPLLKKKKSARLHVLTFVLTLKLETPCLSLSSHTATGDLSPYPLPPFALILYLPSLLSVPGPVPGADDITHTGRGLGPLQAVLSDIHK